MGCQWWIPIPILYWCLARSNCFSRSWQKKRSAEPHGYYGYYGHPYYYGYPYYHHPALKVVDDAAGVHPGGATSSVSRSPQGLRGKRSADPYYYGYYGYPGYGYHGYGASSYV